MVIDNLDCICIADTPYETDTPLIIYPNTILFFSYAFQCLQSIGRWYPEILQKLRIVQHLSTIPEK